MLDVLRRSVTGWVAKILLGLLIISFAVWGIADVFRGPGEGALAKVGDREITTAEFQRALQMELELISRQIGRRPTMEQARQWGFDARVLSRLVAAAALEQQAKELNLGLTDAAVAEAIRQDPAYRGPDGNFSRMAIDYAARELGVSERGLIDMRRREEVREQLTGALAESAVVPKTFLEALHAYREEARTAEHFIIDPAVAIKLPEPTPAQLQETYDANKQRFMTPELRQLAVINLSAAELAKRLAVSDADITAMYEQDKARFLVPERRRLLQLAFKDRAEADKAAAAIAGGRSFEDVAKELGVAESDYSLGMLARSSLIDPQIAEAAFSLDNGAVSGVVEGRFATVIVKVAEIEPGKQRTLDEVKGELRDRIASERVGSELNRLHDEVDDSRAAGRPLKEIASTLNIPFVEVPATDRAGNTPEGKPAFESPDLARIMSAAFQAGIGADSNAIELSDNGYAWVDVVSVTETKQRTFEEAEADVRSLWTQEETRRMLSALATKLVERASQGEPMATLAAEVGGTVETSTNFKRFGGTPGMPDPAITQAFITQKGGAGSAETRDNASRIIFRVTEITPAATATAEELSKLRNDISRQVQGDVISSYLMSVQDKFGVNINETAFLRAIGAQPQQQ